MSINKVILVGRLGKDPETKYTKNGTASTKFSLATSRYYTKDGQKSEETTWHNITVFGTQGENCQKYLEKGSQVYIEGRINYSEYTDKQGVKRNWTEIIGENIQFLSKASNNSNRSSYSHNGPSVNDAYNSNSIRNNAPAPSSGSSYNDEDIPF